MRRTGFGIALLAILVVMAGCSAFSGPTAVGDDQLDAEATYDWDTDADVTIDITESGEYHAVYVIENASTFEIYQNDGFGNKRPVQVSAVRFQYQNGSVVTGSAFTVERTGSRTVFELPARDGKLAFTSSTGEKQLTLPVYRSGVSYEVILPPNRSTSNPVFGDVRPGGYEMTVVDGRRHYAWPEVTANNIHVQYYLDRDIQLFAVILGGAGLVALLLFGRIWRQVRKLQRARSDLGLDVDIERDDDGPPPGMR